MGLNAALQCIHIFIYIIYMYMHAHTHVYIYMENDNPTFFWLNGLDHVFLVITALIIWTRLCEKLLRLFTAFCLTKYQTNPVLLRVGLQSSFDLTIFSGEKTYLTKKAERYDFFP